MQKNNKVNAIVVETPTIVPIIYTDSPISIFKIVPKHSGAETKYETVTAVINIAGIKAITKFLLSLFKYTEVAHKTIIARV